MLEIIGAILLGIGSVIAMAVVASDADGGQKHKRSLTQEYNFRYAPIGRDHLALLNRDVWGDIDQKGKEHNGKKKPPYVDKNDGRYQ